MLADGCYSVAGGAMQFVDIHVPRLHFPVIVSRKYGFGKAEQYEWVPVALHVDMWSGLS